MRRVTCGRGEHAGVFDEAAEDGVGDAGHGGEDGGGRDADAADVQLGGDARRVRHGAGLLDKAWVVPVLLHVGIAGVHFATFLLWWRLR